MDISINRTENLILVRNIMIQNDIWERASEDGQEKKEYRPDKNHLWLLYMLKNEIVGVCQVDVFNCVTLMIHPYLIKDQRHIGRHFIKKTLTWILDHSIKKVEKIIALIPVSYKKVYNCAIKCGFKEEGLLRKQYFKNGELLDQWYMGITHKEILKWAG